jgi:hypothetical protein
MKNIILLSTFTLLLAASLHAQTFSVTRFSDPIVYGTVGQFVDIPSYFGINNLTGSSMQLRLIRINQSIPLGWSTAMCDLHQCYSSFTDTTPWQPYSPGMNDSLSAHFYSDTIPGSGCFTIRVEKNGSSEFHEVNFCATANPIGIRQISSTVKGFNLNQNYPNPFNPTTKIKFSIDKANFVDLRLFDILGREVKALMTQYLGPGEYEVEFEAVNLASGMYYYRLRSGENVAVKKMTLVK